MIAQGCENCGIDVHLAAIRDDSDRWTGVQTLPLVGLVGWHRATAEIPLDCGFQHVPEAVAAVAAAVVAATAAVPATVQPAEPGRLQAAVSWPPEAASSPAEAHCGAVECAAVADAAIAAPPVSGAAAVAQAAAFDAVRVCPEIARRADAGSAVG